MRRKGINLEEDKASRKCEENEVVVRQGWEKEKGVENEMKRMGSKSGGNIWGGD